MADVHIDINKLKLMMARKCMTRKELAKGAGLSVGGIRNAFYKHTCTLKAWGLIAKSLGCDPADLLLDEPNETNN